MNKDFMPDIPAEQRMQLLKDNCDDHEETTYFRELSQNELDIKREELTENLITVSKLDEVLDEAKVKYKAEANPLKLANKMLLTEVKTRRSEVTGILFHIADHESGVMETFNELGEFISSRRLKPHEKQKRLFSVPGKTAEL
jgi:hypothetical protein